MNIQTDNRLDINTFSPCLCTNRKVLYNQKTLTMLILLVACRQLKSFIDDKVYEYFFLSNETKKKL